MAGSPPLIILTGPTACGKSALALELARTYPIEIISADSMQVYKYMDIATAKPSKEEQNILPHHLIDILTPDEEFTAGAFVDMAQKKIDEIRQRGSIPIVIGGTGLYIKALIFGLCPAPKRDEGLRHILKKLETENPGTLWKQLDRLDSITASKVTTRDTARLVRFLEMIYQSGQKPSQMHAEHGFAKNLLDYELICLEMERENLYSRINERVLRMFDDGLVDETKHIMELGYRRDLKSMTTLAYKHVTPYIDGKISQEECTKLIQRDTRHYAKRQITWNKGQYQEHERLSPSAAYDKIERLVKAAWRTGCE